MTTLSNSSSNYLRYLPSIYSNSSPEVGLYLKIFEKVLSGLDDDDGSSPLLADKGIQELLKIMSDLYYPRFSFLFPTDQNTFLPPLGEKQLKELSTYAWSDDSLNWVQEWLNWLSDWFDLNLVESWSVDKKRLMVATVLPLWRKRGTIASILQMLSFYYGLDDPHSSEKLPITSVSVTDQFQPAPLPIIVGTFQIQQTYAQGDAVIGGILPNTFRVDILLTSHATPVQIEQIRDVTIEVLDLMKPASSYAQVVIRQPNASGQFSTIGQSSRVGHWDSQRRRAIQKPA